MRLTLMIATAVGLAVLPLDATAQPNCRVVAGLKLCDDAAVKPTRASETTDSPAMPRLRKAQRGESVLDSDYRKGYGFLRGGYVFDAGPLNSKDALFDASGSNAAGGYIGSIGRAKPATRIGRAVVTFEAEILGIFDSGEDCDTAVSPAVCTDAKLATGALMANAQLDIPLPGGWQPFVSFGLGAAYAWVGLDVDGLETDDGEWGLAHQIRTGIAKRLSDRLSAEAAYRRVGGDVDGADLDVSAAEIAFRFK